MLELSFAERMRLIGVEEGLCEYCGLHEKIYLNGKQEEPQTPPKMKSLGLLRRGADYLSSFFRR